MTASPIDLTASPPPKLKPKPKTLPSLLTIAQTIWLAFNHTSKHLVDLDDQIRTEVYINTPTIKPRLTATQLNALQDQLILQRMPRAIIDAQKCCEELVKVMKELEDAARRDKSHSPEVRATLEVDLPVWAKCLESVRGIIEVSEAQVGAAKRRLGYGS